MKHTPGPWTIGDWNDSIGGVVYRNIFGRGRRVSGVGVYGHKLDGSIAGRKKKDGGFTKTVPKDECDANAHLIAAAPELLEACEQAIDVFSPAATEVSNADYQAVLHAIADAIAKAKGETP